MAGADRAEGHVVRHRHPDRRLDLGLRAAERRRVGRRAGDGAVVHVVDRILPQREDLGEPAADLVDDEHHAERGIAVEAGLAGRGDGHGVVVVVAEFAGGPSLRLVVAEVRAV